MLQKRTTKRILYFLCIFTVSSVSFFCYAEYFAKEYEQAVDGSGISRQWLYVLTHSNNNGNTVVGLMRVSDYDNWHKTSLKNTSFYINDSSMNNYNGFLPRWNSEGDKYVKVKQLSDNGEKQTWLLEYEVHQSRMFFKYQSTNDKATPISFRMKTLKFIIMGISMFACFIYSTIFCVITLLFLEAYYYIRRRRTQS